MRSLAASGYRQGPPFVRLALTPGAVTLVQIAALLPPVMATLYQTGFAGAQAAAALAAVTLVWEGAFALIRHRALTWNSATTALILLVMLPGTVPVWQLALAASFGVVLAELVFGGRGFGFANAAVVSLAFLIFSFPGSGIAANTPLVAASTLPGAMALILTGLVSWRVLISAFAALALSVTLSTGEADLVVLLTAIAFALLFLVADPLAAASTNLGRWVYGLLVGGLAIFFDTGAGSAPSLNALVFAALLGSIFAPLIDHLVVMAMVAWRRRKRG